MFKTAVHGIVPMVLAGLVFASVSWAAAGDSAVYVELRGEDIADAPVVERWKLYDASYALVIGIDDYSQGWPRLSNAVKDAEAVAASLAERGFEVSTLRNPDGEQLRSALRNFFAFKGSDPQARLFIWFAGHGYTELGEGYLVPADAPDPSEPAFRAVALHMGDVGSMVRIARSKHVFAVFDSCFAGTIFNSSRARPPAAITRAATQPVRQFLTSGDADQQVADDGSFRRLFLKALAGDEQVDANRDGYLTGSELSLYLEDRVVNLTNSAQTPRSGKLRDQRFDQGDFIFLLPASAGRQSAAAGETPSGEATGSRALAAPDPELAVELAFWDAIKNSDSAEDYQAYLTAYPQGRFAVLADSRMTRLETGAAAREAEDARHHQAEAELEAQASAQLAALAPQAHEDPAEHAEMALGLGRGDRKELQQALTALGFDTKGVDGFFGPATRKAIKDYQLSKASAPTGYLTADLASALLAEAPRPAEPAQTASVPPPPAISKNEAAAYIRANASAMKRDLMEYNQRYRAILGSYGGAAERLDIVSWQVERVSGDEAVVAVSYREPIVVLAGNSGTQKFLLKWTGAGFAFVGHEAEGSMRRAGG